MEKPLERKENVAKFSSFVLTRVSYSLFSFFFSMLSHPIFVSLSFLPLSHTSIVAGRQIPPIQMRRSRAKSEAAGGGIKDVIRIEAGSGLFRETAGRREKKFTSLSLLSNFLSLPLFHLYISMVRFCAT